MGFFMSAGKAKQLLQMNMLYEHALRKACAKPCNTYAWAERKLINDPTQIKEGKFLKRHGVLTIFIVQKITL